MSLLLVVVSSHFIVNNILEVSIFSLGLAFSTRFCDFADRLVAAL